MKAGVVGQSTTVDNSFAILYSVQSRHKSHEKLLSVCVGKAVLMSYASTTGSSRQTSLT